MQRLAHRVAGALLSRHGLATARPQLGLAAGLVGLPARIQPALFAHPARLDPAARARWTSSSSSPPTPSGADFSQALVDELSPSTPATASPDPTDPAAAGDGVDAITTAAQKASAKTMGRMLRQNERRERREKARLRRPVPEAHEQRAGEVTRHPFQTETKRILDIMSKSLYTQREVFLRELISNASDALEKVRYLQQTADGAELVDAHRDLELHIALDPEKRTLSIQDFGIGMTSKELLDNLGVIARSGSKQFAQHLVESGEPGSDTHASIIGQFGVGFYSTFIVADRVDVYSRSAKHPEECHFWSSDGTGEFELAEADGVERGTKIICHLKQDAVEFCDPVEVEKIIKRYSNFVGFPIYLNGERVNTFDALWLKKPEEVSSAEHRDFYRYLANAWDYPAYVCHFHTEMPVEIKALLYIPERHLEKQGFGRMESGVSLYSRKVLIQGKSEALVPEWLRFLRGVVDSEDVPLNISRETLQDSALIKRISNFITKRVVRTLDEQSRKDPKGFRAWYEEFSHFVSEGVVTDFAHKEEIAKLLRYASSHEDGVVTSLDDYVGRMRPSQKAIFYIVAPSRLDAEQSPYYEAFQQHDIEVLYLYQSIDEFVIKALNQYAKRPFVSIETAGAAEHLPAVDSAVFAGMPEGASATAELAPELSKAEEKELVEWLNHCLHDQVLDVTLTSRHTSAPAIVVDHESAAVRSVMNFVNKEYSSLPKQKLEVNAKHPLMRMIHKHRSTDVRLCQNVALQVYDNALIAASVMDNPRTMLPRINEIMLAAFGVKDA